MPKIESDVVESKPSRVKRVFSFLLQRVVIPFASALAFTGTFWNASASSEYEITKKPHPFWTPLSLVVLSIATILNLFIHNAPKSKFWQGFQKVFQKTSSILYYWALSVLVAAKDGTNETLPKLLKMLATGILALCLVGVLFRTGLRLKQKGVKSFAHFFKQLFKLLFESLELILEQPAKAFYAIHSIESFISYTGTMTDPLLKEAMKCTLTALFALKSALESINPNLPGVKVLRTLFTNILTTINNSFFNTEDMLNVIQHYSNSLNIPNYKVAICSTAGILFGISENFSSYNKEKYPCHSKKQKRLSDDISHKEEYQPLLSNIEPTPKSEKIESIVGANIQEDAVFQP